MGAQPMQNGKNSTPAFLSADSEVSLVQISGRCISDPGVSSWNSFTAQSQSADVTVRCAETLGRYVVDLVHLANRTLDKGALDDKSTLTVRNPIQATCFKLFLFCHKNILLALLTPNAF